MKELKCLQRIFMLLFAGIVLCAMQACGDDEEEFSLNGTWACDHHYGSKTDTYIFNTDGTYSWACSGYTAEKGYYSYNKTLLTLTLSSIGKTKLYTIVTLTASYFVLMDGAGKTYTYMKNTNPNENSNNDYLIIDGHEYVDLGLPSGLKWATCNVGASTPEEYGDYFAWGETSTKSSYTEVTYYENIFSGISGNSWYDAARANWGGSWRLPTKAECQELVDKCTWTWTTLGKHKGCKVIGPNGNSIFLPAAGYRYGVLYNAGDYGCYWGDTPHDGDAQGSYILFDSGSHKVYWNHRVGERSIRPVSD